MIIKEREYKVCPECGDKKLVKEEKYGCDNCEKPIDFDKQDEEREHLDITVFYKDESCEAKHLHFCSWRCVFEKLKTINTDSFISLPYLSFDMVNREMGAEGFREALRRQK